MSSSIYSRHRKLLKALSQRRRPFSARDTEIILENLGLPHSPKSASRYINTFIETREIACTGEWTETNGVLYIVTVTASA